MGTMNDEELKVALENWTKRYTCSNCKELISGLDGMCSNHMCIKCHVHCTAHKGDRNDLTFIAPLMCTGAGIGHDIIGMVNQPCPLCAAIAELKIMRVWVKRLEKILDKADVPQMDEWANEGGNGTLNQPGELQ